MKRFLGIFLSLLLVLSTFSLISVFAADPDESVTSSDAEYAWVDVAVTSKLINDENNKLGGQTVWDGVVSGNDVYLYNLIDFDANRQGAVLYNGRYISIGSASTYSNVPQGKAFIFELKEPEAVSKLVLVSEQLSTHSVVIAGSNDNSEYTELAEFTWTEADGTNGFRETQKKIEKTFDNTTQYKYYKLYLKNATSGFTVNNVQLLVNTVIKPDGYELTKIVPNRAYKTALTGKSVDGATNVEVNSANRFSDTSGRTYVSDGIDIGSVTYDMGRILPISKLDFYVATKSDCPFLIKASKDGNNWDMIYLCVSSQAGNGYAELGGKDGKEYDNSPVIYLDNEPYRYFRFERPTNVSGDDLSKNKGIFITGFEAYTPSQTSSYWQSQFPTARKYSPVETLTAASDWESFITLSSVENKGTLGSNPWGIGGYKIFDGSTTKEDNGKTASDHCSATNADYINIDLGELHTLGGVKMNWNYRVTNYNVKELRVLGSKDNVNWNLLLNTDVATADADLQEKEVYFEPAEYRYIQIYAPDCNSSSAMQINELELYAIEEAPAKLGVSNSAVAENTWTYKFENNSTAKVDYYEIIAEYSNAAKTAMTSVTANKKEAPADKVTKGNVDLTGKTHVKCFVWDSNTLKPYSDVTFSPAE